MTRLPDLVHQWHHEGRVTRFTWVGDLEVAADRVYALAFAGDGRLLVVSDGSGVWWLPGGGVEDGETEQDALGRELREESGATVRRSQRLGCQFMEDTVWGREYHAFYWCRVSLPPRFAPTHEVTEIRLVPPDEFLDVLFWGRDDPKGEVLLEAALELDARHRA